MIEEQGKAHVLNTATCLVHRPKVEETKRWKIEEQLLRVNSDVNYTVYECVCVTMSHDMMQFGVSGCVGTNVMSHV